MFDLIEPELTPREKEDIEAVQKWHEKKIIEAIDERMNDPVEVVHAFKECLETNTDCVSFIIRAVMIPDLEISNAVQYNINNAVRRYIEDEVKKDAERGML